MRSRGKFVAPARRRRLRQALIAGAVSVVSLSAAAIAVSGDARAPRSAVGAAVTQKLLGTWRLTSAVIHDENGNTVGPLYPNDLGKLTYTSRGDVWALVAERKRSGNEAAVWYTGTFEVRPNAHAVVHHVQYGSPASLDGTDQLRRYRFSGDRRLTLEGAISSTHTAVLKWRKAGADWGKPRR